MSEVSARPKLKTPTESRRYGIDCTLDLEEGETISGINSVSIDNATTPPLVTASAAVNSATFKNEAGGVCQIGKGIRLTISGGKDGSGYVVTISYSTSLGNTPDAVFGIDCRAK